jgi:hypothetical protein
MKVCKSFVFGFFNNKKGKHSEDHQLTDIILHGGIMQLQEVTNIDKEGVALQNGFITINFTRQPSSLQSSDCLRRI